MQLGVNVIPSGWSVAGKLKESVQDQPGPEGFHTLTLVSSEGVADGFEELSCTFLNSTPVISLFSQDGKKHSFTIDTGALETYIRPEVAESINQGSDEPFPMALQIGKRRWLHVKAQVDRRIKVLTITGPDFPVDGIMGMNAVAAMQLKIDYRHHRVWARINTSPLTAESAGKEFGSRANVTALPIQKTETGRYTIEVQTTLHRLPLELDTGADLIGIGTQTAQEYKLRKIGEGDVLVQSGAKKMSVFLLEDFRLGPHQFLFPVAHEGPTQETGLGGLGPSRIPCPTVLLDYPNHVLYTANATEDEKIEEGLGQLISGTVHFEKDEVVLDMPTILGTERATLLKINDTSIYKVLEMLRKQLKEPTQTEHLVKLFQALNHIGSLTYRQSGKYKIFQIGR